MAKEIKKETKAEAPAPEKPAKSKAKLFIIIGIVVVLLAGGGGAAWYFLAGKSAAKEGSEKSAAAPKSDKPAKPPVFVALETFTVNLQPESGEHILQTTINLKVVDVAVEAAVKLQMPEIRSRLLLLLSSKKPSELTSIDGKQALADQIADEVNFILSPATAKKPAARSAETKADSAAKPAEGATDATAKPALPKKEASPAPTGPVLSVLYTNFIIQ